MDESKSKTIHREKMQECFHTIRWHEPWLLADWKEREKKLEAYLGMRNHLHTCPLHQYILSLDPYFDPDEFEEQDEYE